MNLISGPKVEFLLKRFSKSRLRFQVIAEGRNNYIRSGFFESVQTLLSIVQNIYLFSGGFGGIFPLGEYVFIFKVK